MANQIKNPGASDIDFTLIPSIKNRKSMNFLQTQTKKIDPHTELSSFPYNLFLLFPPNLFYLWLRTHSEARHLLVSLQLDIRFLFDIHACLHFLKRNGDGRLGVRGDWEKRREGKPCLECKNYK